MLFECNQKEADLFSGDLLVYFIRESKGKAVPCPSRIIRRALKPAWKSGDFRGKKGQSFLYYPSASAKGLAAGRVLAQGADKISINTPALENPALIDAMVKAFGSQCVVIGVDSIAEGERWTVRSHTGTPDAMRTPGRETLAWLDEVVGRGAGEVVLNCMSADGTRAGYDIGQLVAARAVLPDQVDRKTAVRHGAQFAQFVHALHAGNAALAASCVVDHIAEPYRRELLPGFDEARVALKDTGALAVGISGSGPTVFALVDDYDVANRTAAWLDQHYRKNDSGFVHICRADLGGARCID